MPSSIQEFFRRLPEHLDRNAAEGFTAVYQFELSGSEGGQYTVTVSEGVCSVQEGGHPDPDVTFTMSAEDCVGVLSDRLDPYSVFLSGRIRVSGDLSLAVQLKSLFPTIR